MYLNSIQRLHVHSIQYSYPFYPILILFLNLILAHFPFNPMPKLIQSFWGERSQSLVFNKAHFRSSAILSICCGKAGMQDQDGESRCTEKVGLIHFPCRPVKSSSPLICTYKNAENACFTGYTLPIITAVYICQFQHSFFITEY